MPGQLDVTQPHSLTQRPHSVLPPSLLHLYPHWLPAVLPPLWPAFTHIYTLRCP